MGDTEIKWGIGPFPWRVTPLEWLCGRIFRLPLGWLYRRWPNAYLWIGAKAYTASELPRMRRRWKDPI